MPKLGQHFHIPSGLVSETEVEPFMYFARMQAFLEYPLGELPRRHQGEIAPEGKHQHRINPRPLQPAKLLRQRCKQFRTRFRFQNSRRVRFERNRYGLSAIGSRPQYDFSQHVGMGTVDAVEISHTDERGPEVRRYLFKFVKYVHKRKKPVSGPEVRF